MLKNLGADALPTIIVINKMDKVDDPSTRVVLRHHFPEAVFVSAQTGEGLDKLLERLACLVAGHAQMSEFLIPADRADLIARLHREAVVHRIAYHGHEASISATLPERSQAAFAPYQVARTEQPTRRA